MINSAIWIDNYESLSRTLARAGYRVLALGWKKVNIKPAMIRKITAFMLKTPETVVPVRTA